MLDRPGILGSAESRQMGRLTVLLGVALIASSSIGLTENASAQEHLDGQGGHFTQGDNVDYSAEEIEGTALAYGITNAEAKSVRAFELRAIRVIEVAESRFPDTFGDAWIEGRAQAAPRLVLAFTSDAQAKTEDIKRSTKEDIAVRAITSQRSRASIRNLRQEVRADWKHLSERFGLFGMSIRPGTNKLILQVGSDADVEQAQRYVDERYDTDALIVEGGAPPEDSSIPPAASACEVVYESCNPLRGGIHLQELGCSVGFNATRKDTGGRVVTTAAHCNDLVAKHSNAVVGGMVRQQEFNTIDGQINSVASGWSTSRWVMLHNQAQAYQISSVYTGTNLANATVCTSGYKSGPFDGSANCGPVTDPDWEGTDSEGDMFSNQFIFQPRVAMVLGDSGGPVFYSGQARGIRWGFSGSKTWASYATYVQSVLGVNITIS